MKMPTLFIGHGSPMIAISDNEISRNFIKIGNALLQNYPKPKAILMISAHWYTDGNLIQSVDKPNQIYDMYGFPKELYDLKYQPKGDKELTNKLLEILGPTVSIDNNWGIDHGAWSVLVHMFTKADIPVVQLSVNRNLSYLDTFKLGEKLAILRDCGYLMIASGNVVHNLSKIEWENKGGSKQAYDFDELIKNHILNEDYDQILNHVKDDINYKYAVPTKDHFLPLIYVLGASKDSKITVFNNICNLGSMSMTSYLFEPKII